MSAFLIALKLFAGNALSAVWKFLKHASFWQLVSIGLAGLCILLWFQRNDARSDAARWQKQDAAHVAELKRITAAKSAQKQTTDKNVAKVIEGQRVVQKIVQVIHDAPNPPDCGTPGLSTLREVL
jgi:hypothetical protein